jgi:hypothetical protein
VRAPEVARALDAIACETSRAALREIMTRARPAELLSGQPAEMAEQFVGLLWGTRMVSLLLRVADRPNPREIIRRARDATTAFLQLHLQPDTPETARPLSARARSQRAEATGSTVAGREAAF